ncbi:MAG TPA: N-acetylmuramoyl-L-alanine amidase [Reyranella sp.]
MFKSEVSAPLLRGALTVLVMLAGLLLGSGGVLAQAEPPQILGARVSSTPERARLIVDLSASTTYAIVSLDDPERIAVDLHASGVATVATQPVAGNGIVASFTTTMTDGGTARAELTLSQPAVVQQAYMLDPVADQPAQLVVDLIGTTELDFKARVAADLANSLSSTLPGASSDAPSAAPSEEVAPASAEPPPPVSSEQPGSAASAAPELPTDPASRPLVVIDPGHGGVDNGASAPSGIHEKDITLAFALQLRDLLVKSGHFDVALTRDDDTYLTLNERVDLARQNKADLFISLHADTFQEADIRGASIYTRDENATDILDKVLADGENHADIVAGYVPKDEKPAVVDILVDLMRRQVRQQAYLAAEDIVKAMEPSVALRRFPVRQADFFVLQAPDIPSMLIELGFMSNPADIANLEDNDWRNKVVAAIANGVDAYFKDLRAGG